MDKLTTMKTFRSVVEQGSFAAASRALRLSRSAVSKHVGQLEDELGIQLLNRTTRSVSLSATGRAYYERISTLLDELDNVEREARSENTVVRGQLRVAAPMSLGIKVIAPALPSLMKRHPDLELDLQLSDRLVDVVEEGVDVVIRVATTLEDSGLVCRRLGPAPRVLVASPSYLEHHGTPETPQDLQQHPCLLYSRARYPNQWPFEADGEVFQVPVDGPLRADNSIALVEAARAGLGVLFTPRFFVEEDLKEGRLVEILSDASPVGHSVYALYPSSRHFSARARAFVDFAVELFREGLRTLSP